ncbi:MAG: UxaA family hydrolase [Lachnospiraceae bacterium]|nr:UxaA family hydrolase [Lachnospiraceae bacterium]
MMNPRDNVCIIVSGTGVKAGDEVQVGDRVIVARQDIAVPHKMAVQDIKKGETIYKYGFFIGFATEDIRTGDHVHIHNLGT